MAGLPAVITKKVHIQSIELNDDETKLILSYHDYKNETDKSSTIMLNYAPPGLAEKIVGYGSDKDAYLKMKSKVVGDKTFYNIIDITSQSPITGSSSSGGSSTPSKTTSTKPAYDSKGQTIGMAIKAAVDLVIAEGVSNSINALTKIESLARHIIDISDRLNKGETTTETSTKSPVAVPSALASKVKSSKLASPKIKEPVVQVDDDGIVTFDEDMDDVPFDVNN